MSNVSVQPKSPIFFDLYSRGEALPDEIDDFIDRWHERGDPLAKVLPLHEYLGLTREEYEMWVHVPDILPHILVARRESRPLTDVLNDYVEEFPMAARSADAARVGLLREWLEKRRKS